MKAITSNKWALLLFGFLIVSNLVTVGILLSRKKSYRSISEQIDLPKPQADYFAQQKDSFINAMKPRWAEINQLKDSLYSKINEPQLTDSVMLHYVDKWNAINRQNDSFLFRHFQNLRKHCPESHLAAYDSVVRNMMSRRSR